MPDVQEVYEMITKHKPPEPGALERQQKRQVRAARNKKFAAFALAAAIGVVAIGLILVMSPEQDTTTPLNEPSVVNPADAAAVQVVTDFLGAIGTYDADQAFTYLADDADLTYLIGSDGAFAPGSLEGLRLQIAWNEASGYREMLDSCEASTSAVSGNTTVRCTSDFHGIRSEEIGLGPYSGTSTALIVRDGLIVGTLPGSINIEEFSPQMWEPFRNWVSTTYPKDLDVMYTGGGSNFRLTEESIRLWELRTKEYVKEVLRTQGQ